MRTKKRFVLLATAAMAAVSLMAVPSAQASTAQVNCAFDGLAGNIRNNPVKAILNGTGGTGLYDFAGDAIGCTYVDSDGDALQGGAHIESHGTFSNIVCGTGTATGNSAAGQTTITSSVAGVPAVTQVDYSITFVGGQGVMTITRVNGQPANGGGFVQIRVRPTDATSGNCVTTDVTAFDVSGTFSAALPTQGT